MIVDTPPKCSEEVPMVIGNTPIKSSTLHQIQKTPVQYMDVDNSPHTEIKKQRQAKRKLLLKRELFKQDTKRQKLDGDIKDLGHDTNDEFMEVDAPQIEEDTKKTQRKTTKRKIISKRQKQTSTAPIKKKPIVLRLEKKRTEIVKQQEEADFGDFEDDSIFSVLRSAIGEEKTRVLSIENQPHFVQEWHALKVQLVKDNPEFGSQTEMDDYCSCRECTERVNVKLANAKRLTNK